MKLLGSTKKLEKDKNGEKCFRLKMTDLVLVHCNLANNIYPHMDNYYWRFR